MKVQKLKEMIRLCCILLVMMLAGLPCLKAQKAALKTNLLSDVFLNPNVGAEVAIADKWTFDLSGQLNLWTVDERKWKHWLLQPEARYWFCRHFQGHFVGIHALGGEYNMGKLDLDFKMLGTDFRKLKDRRYQGWFGGAGIAYGYDWIINLHWDIEAEIGLGWTYTRFDAYPCAVCGTKLDSGHHNYFGPTKAAINLKYVF